MFVSAKQLQKEIESKPPSEPDQSSQHSADSDHSDGIEDSQEKAVPLVVYRYVQSNLFILMLNTITFSTLNTMANLL